MPFGGIVIAMESNLQNTSVPGHKFPAMLIAVIIAMSATSLSAETYRWKDKDGKVHYGAAVPAEYADQPYDILNKAGQVIERVEDTTIPLEVRAEKKITKKEREPLISEETRRIQSDKLLVIRYSSEEDILKAQEVELAQLGYDTKVINQSYQRTTAAIRGEISQAADKQRAGQQIGAETQNKIEQLYVRRAQDQQKRDVMTKRETRIRARYQAELERYRYLTSEDQDSSEDQDRDQAPTDQG